jgi:dephospho-CoA kinase
MFAPMVTVGLTGGIGSGKSTVAGMLRRLGAPVVDSDELAREVVAPGEPALAEIRAAFGPGVLRADGSLDRSALGRVVFSDPEARRRLEAITHPRVRALAEARVAELRRAGEPACVLDVPLLFETGQHAGGRFDEIWVVAASPETQVRRAVARGGLDEGEVRRRMAAQWPLDAKARLADRVIDNEGSLAQTEAQVRAAWRAVLDRARRTGAAGGKGSAGGPGRDGPRHGE